MFSQKKVEKQLLVGTHISTIAIELNKVSSITLKSTSENFISIKAISEGEYADSFVISDYEHGNTINIVGEVSFMFFNIQDKLSAHKVHAITLEITVPERLLVHLNSDIGNLKASGFYTNLTASLITGNCLLMDVSGEVIISSLSGNIFLEAKSGMVLPETRSGSIIEERLPLGKSVFKLKTVKGDINIVQTN